MAKLPGRLISQQLVIGFAARVMTKAIYEHINNIIQCHGYTSADPIAWTLETRVLPKDSQLRTALQFWLGYTFGPTPMVRDQSLASIKLVVDSSDVATGAFIDGLGPRRLFHAPLPTELIPQSSTHRELFGVLNALKFYAQQLYGKTLLVRTDNQGVFYILGGTEFSGGSNLRTMNTIAQHIITLMTRSNFVIIVQWHRRNTVEAQLADALSKIKDNNDWVLAEKPWLKISKKFGPFSLDIFASSKNTKCNAFFSFYNEPGSCGSAMASAWKGNVFCFPPWPMILHAIRRFINQKARGVLVVPKWTNSNWFYLLKKYQQVCLGRLEACLIRGPRLPKTVQVPTPTVELLAVIIH